MFTSTKTVSSKREEKVKLYGVTETNLMKNDFLGWKRKRKKKHFSQRFSCCSPASTLNFRPISVLYALGERRKEERSLHCATFVIVFLPLFVVIWQEPREAESARNRLVLKALGAEILSMSTKLSLEALLVLSAWAFIHDIGTCVGVRTARVYD